MSAKKDVVLKMGTSGSLPEKDVHVHAPVTVKKLLDVMSAFYKRRIIASEYDGIEACGELKYWNHIHDMTTFKRKVRTYADLKGDYNAFSGLVRRSSVILDGLFGRVPVYAPLWSS